MAKRFTDTDKYKDPWFRKLSPKLKMLFLFMCDDCNHAGIWKENLDLFSFVSGYDATLDDIALLGDKVSQVSVDSYFIHGFIKFQYGYLNPENNAHLGVIRALNYVGIDHQPFLAPTEGHGRSPGIRKGTGTISNKGRRTGTGSASPAPCPPAPLPPVSDLTVDDVPF